MSVAAVLILALALPLLGQPGRAVPETLNEIDSETLRSHVYFLASDYLRGRDTPSEGLEIAAEYIASQFARAGLMPAVGDSYFQPVPLAHRNRPARAESLNLRSSILPPLSPDIVASIWGNLAPIAEAPVIKVDYAQPESYSNLPPDKVRGAILMMNWWEDLLDPAHASERGRVSASWNKGMQALVMHDPAAIVYVRRTMLPPGPAFVLDPAAPVSGTSRLQYIRVHSAELFQALAKIPAGGTDARMTLNWPQPQDRPFTVRNVLGLLPGSDAHLKSTCVVVGAHYDHAGVLPSGDDRILNGANDNAGGVAVMIEIAAALAKAAERPKRTILFAAWTAEEKGLLGSAYFVRNPIYPLNQLIGNLNLEVVGRTGPATGVKVTGRELSDMQRWLRPAAAASGIVISEEPDRFFERSDNFAFARAGIPAHSIAGAGDAPDLHQPGDDADKLNYEYMQRIAQWVAKSAFRLADDQEEPQWSETEQTAQPYREAHRQRRLPATP
jgi:hypothetical protein